MKPQRFEDRLGRPYKLERGERMIPVRSSYSLGEYVIFERVTHALVANETKRAQVMHVFKQERASLDDNGLRTLLALVVKEMRGLTLEEAMEIVGRRIEALLAPGSAEILTRTKAVTARDLARPERLQAVKQSRKFRHHSQMEPTPAPLRQPHQTADGKGRSRKTSRS
jgi:hypothetical protein